MTAFPLPAADPAANAIRTDQLERLWALIERHRAEGRYPGAQVALARHGKLLVDRTFGEGVVGTPAKPDTLWLLYSNTKVVTATALWKLCEQGAFRFTDRVSDHLPGFERHGKRDVTIFQVITHQGGFPNAVLPKSAWLDHAKMRDAVCDFTLEWTPGTRIHYHGLSAHWVLGVLIEALTGADYRSWIREHVLAPIGLANDLFVGVTPAEDGRVSTMYEPDPAGAGIRPLAESNNETWRRSGAPGGGGYGTARGMVALYQMMLAGGELNGVRLLSPRMLAYAIRNHTGDRVDEYMGMPMHRGLGPHLRGLTPTVRGIGAIASPNAYGHGGVGTSYCWADPDSGVSFAYITNNRLPDPWHSERLDAVSTLVHAAIL
ncbi:MAG: serine hydrolase domain-containing protein [Burkholderiaceae bacterium]